MFLTVNVLHIVIYSKEIDLDYSGSTSRLVVDDLTIDCSNIINEDVVLNLTTSGM